MSIFHERAFSCYVTLLFSKFNYAEAGFELVPVNINPILTVWEGNMEKYQLTSVHRQRSIFFVLPNQMVSICFVTRLFQEVGCKMSFLKTILL